MLLSKSMIVATKHNKDIYYKLLELPDEEVDGTIKRDLDRTIMVSESNLLKDKKQKLFNVLKAYSVYDQAVSYVQGTNYIVGLLLSNINSERAAFWTFVQIMNEKNWRDMFIDNTPKLLRMLDILVKNIEIKLKDLYTYFVEIEVKYNYKGFSLSNSSQQCSLISSYLFAHTTSQSSMQIEYWTCSGFTKKRLFSMP